MTGLAGECRFDGAPPDAAGVSHMLDALAHRGRCREWVTDGHAVIASMSRAPAGEPSEARILRDEATGLIVAFDGRIDNTGDLRSALASSATRALPDSDAALVFRAYREWGRSCVDRLVGDFVLVIRDARRERIFAARDVFGVRPFFYRFDAGVFRFAAEPQALLRAGGRSIRPNAGMVAEHLAGIVTSRDETLIEGLWRLPPAHALTVDARGLVKTRYWRIDPAHHIGYRNDADYETHLRELFAEAVRCRLKGTRQIAVMLSGGLDSSCILGQVQSLAATAGTSPVAQAFSLTCPGRPCDESRFVDDVVDRWQPVAHACPDRPLDWVEIARQEAVRYLDVPTYPNNSAADPLRLMIRDRGCGVALSGVGGDEWFRGSASMYADLVRRGRLAAFGRRVWQDASGPDFVGWHAAARLAIWPLVPRRMQRLVKAALRRDVTPPSVAASFAGETALRRRLASLDRDWRFPDVTRREILCEATSGEAVRALEQVDRSAAWFGFEERHPFLDRRLAQFAFAIPPDQHWREGWPKSLMRRAFRQLLPVSVATRRGRPDYSHWVVEAVQAHARAGLFERLITADLGWVEPKPVIAAYGEMIGNGTRGVKWLWPLWAVCAVEHWARAIFAAPPIVAPSVY